MLLHHTQKKIKHQHLIIVLFRLSGLRLSVMIQSSFVSYNIIEVEVSILSASRYKNTIAWRNESMLHWTIKFRTYSLMYPEQIHEFDNTQLSNVPHYIWRTVLKITLKLRTVVRIIKIIRSSIELLSSERLVGFML